MRKILSILVMSLLSQSAFAHSDLVATLMAGLIHPLSGWDHILAMALVGMLMVHYPMRQRLLLPLTFVAAFLLALVLGSINALPLLNLSMINSGILWSVMLLGSLLVWQMSLAKSLPKFFPKLLTKLLTKSLPKSLPIPYCLMFLSVFGFFHGAAHAIELEVQTNVTLGLMLATIGLHLAGYLVASFTQHQYQWITRSFAWLASLVGLLGLFGLAF